jgi:VWFA-related protein
LLTAINGFRPNVPPYPMRQRIQVTLDALKTLADRMSGAAGRKSIVWITGGFPRIQAYDGTIQKTLNKINDSNVAIYPIDARGLTLGGAASNLQTMELFAESTGGEACYNRNDVSVAIEEAIEDSKSTLRSRLLPRRQRSGSPLP